MLQVLQEDGNGGPCRRTHPAEHPNGLVLSGNPLRIIRQVLGVAYHRQQRGRGFDGEWLNSGQEVNGLSARKKGRGSRLLEEVGQIGAGLVARDLLQDVFIKVYENMDSFEKRSQIYTWIYRIAVNHAINYMRRDRRTLWFNLLDETVGEFLKREKIEISGLGGGDVPRPDELLERSEADQSVQRAVDSLPVKYRVPFVLFKDEHLSYNEISSVLDLSLSAVESRIHRARKMLVKKLSPLLK